MSLPDNVAIAFGYGNVGRGCASGLRGIGAHVVEIDPLHVLEALMEGFLVPNLEGVVSEANIFVTTIMNRNVITVQHMRQMKNNAILVNVGEFENKIDIEGLKTYQGVQRVTIKPFICDRFLFPESNRSIVVLAEGKKLNFASASSQLSFVRSFSFTNQLMALLELWNERKVYVLPRHLKQKVARLHLSQLGAKVTKLF